MNNPRRFKQDAVIIMGILVLILLLWQLHMHSRHYGGLGGWVTTNIFGSATLSVIAGEPGDQTNATPVPTNAPVTVVTGGSAQPTHPPPGETPTGGAPPPPLSTNLLRSNGPVTVIDVPAADLVQTPPGVTYASNVAEAATIERRLGEAAAKGGDIQISLSWNNYNDLDLHCVDPKGEEIWFSHTISAQTGGVLDVDRNAQAPYTPTPVENIYWPDRGAPPGLYKVFVVYYAPRNGMDPSAPTPFTVRVVVKDWKTSYFRSTISFTGHQEPKPICTLDYEPGNADPAQRFRFVR